MEFEPRGGGGELPRPAERHEQGYGSGSPGLKLVAFCSSTIRATFNMTSSLPRIFLYPLAMEIYVWPGIMGASLRASRALPLSTNEYLIEYGFENKVVPVAADLPRF